jgi:hypothetical protein
MKTVRNCQELAKDDLVMDIHQIRWLESLIRGAHVFLVLPIFKVTTDEDLLFTKTRL